jgi:hypothetical protein
MPLQLYKIATIEVGSGGASSMIFSSIPQGYTDLKITFSARSEGTSTTAALLRLNGSSANGSNRGLEGNGVTAITYVDSSQSYAGNIVPGNYTVNTFCNNEIYIPNYTSSNYKSSSVDTVTENVATIYALQNIQANLWSNTAAVTSISLIPNGTNNFAQYTIATLYGIL